MTTLNYDSETAALIEGFKAGSLLKLQLNHNYLVNEDLARMKAKYLDV